MSDGLSQEIRQLILDVGEAGVEEMTRRPGLAAAVDQHAAAVRDVVEASGEEMHASLLLDYLYDFTDTAVERGWWPAANGFDWETVRVISVCWMVQTLCENQA